MGVDRVPLDVVTVVAEDWSSFTAVSVAVVAAMGFDELAGIEMSVSVAVEDSVLVSVTVSAPEAESSVSVSEVVDEMELIFSTFPFGTDFVAIGSCSARAYWGK